MGTIGIIHVTAPLEVASPTIQYKVRRPWRLTFLKSPLLRDLFFNTKDDKILWARIRAESTINIWLSHYW